MTRPTKSVTAFRSEIGTFEKEVMNPFYKYQVKEYNTGGQLILETEFRPNGLKEWETSYEYDEKQNLVSKKTYYPQEETTEMLIHLYDDKGNKIMDENYFGEDLFEKVSYGFDDKGNIISQARLDEDENEIEKLELTRDADGKITRQMVYTNGEPEREVNFIFNEAGLCIKEEHRNIPDSSLEITTFEYNEAGKKIKSDTKDADGNETGYVDVEYDEHMNPVKYTSETSGFYNSKAVHQLAYDEENRVIENEFFDVLNSFLMSKEKIVYDEEGNIKEQEIFEINPQGGMKKTHYLLQLQYDFYAE